MFDKIDNIKGDLIKEQCFIEFNEAIVEYTHHYYLIDGVEYTSLYLEDLDRISIKATYDLFNNY